MTHPNPNFDENAIKEMVQKAMIEGIGKGSTDKEETTEPVPVVQESGPKPETKTAPLDAEDSIRMENFLLRQQVEGLTIKLEDQRREKAQTELEEAKKGLEEFLVKKHGIDSENFRISLDPSTYTLSIIPL